jgi:hypothetical protein
MIRKEYEYRPMFSKETNDNMKIFHEITEDCIEILGSQKYMEPFTGEKSGEPTNETMTKYNQYLMKYTNETNRGVLRTLLIIGKPYKNHPIVKETLTILADELRKGSTTGFI